jgi:predicted acylesterase/phospholipase RssA
VRSSSTSSATATAAQRIRRGAPTEPTLSPQHTASLRRSFASVAKDAFDTLRSGAQGVPNAAKGSRRRVRAVANEMADQVANLGVNVLSRYTERAMGLSVRQLLDFDRFFYTGLRMSHGEPSPLLRALLAEQGVYVYLGGPPQEISPVERLIVEEFGKRRYDKFPSEPPPQLEAKYHPVWARLLERHRRGEMLVDIVLGDDPSVQSPASLMAVRTYEDARKFRTQLMGAARREQGYWHGLHPWLAANKPELHARLDEARDLLTPGWLKGDDNEVIGWTTPPRNALRALELVLPVAGEELTGKSLADFADALAALRSDTLSGNQSYWGKLVRELPSDKRATLLAGLTHAALALHLAPPSERQVLLPGAPDEFALHDREAALRSVSLRCLMLLHPVERAQFVGMLVERLRSASPELAARATRIQALVPSHRPIDLAALRDLDEVARRQSLGQLSNELRPPLQAALLDPACDPQMRDDIQQELGLLSWLQSVTRIHLRNELVPDGVLDRPVGIGQFHGGYSSQVLRVSELDRRKSNAPVGAPLRVGGTEGGPALKVSMVLEGGGGKGFAYPSVLHRVQEALARSERLGFVVDEYVGTSAGALTAALLAAGYRPFELMGLMKELDFAKFYGDFVGLMGESDPKVGGARRSGIFSTRLMYQAMQRLIGPKVGVSGRPILFRDLPANLKVVATVVSDDLPEALRKELGIGPDGKLVFSKETTPNFDVVAAICASAAVPGFFAAPLIQVWRPDPEAPGKLVEHHLELVDGGVLNNFPVAEASREPDGNSVLVALPVYYEEPEPAPSRRISAEALLAEAHSRSDAALEARASQAKLSTLDFSPSQVSEVDAHNLERLQHVEQSLPQFLEQAHAKGVKRAVLGFNLSTAQEQSSPVVQGADREQTYAFVRLADQVGMPCLDAENAARVVESNLNRSSPTSKVGQYVFEWLMDRGSDGVYETSLFGTPRYRPKTEPVEGLWDVIRSTLASRFVSQSLTAQYLFEKG